MYQPDRYPRNWQKLAYACKERANWQCEGCGVTQRTQRISKRTGAVYSVFLHAAHTKLHDTNNILPVLPAMAGWTGSCEKLKQKDRLKSTSTSCFWHLGDKHTDAP